MSRHAPAALSRRPKASPAAAAQAKASLRGAVLSELGVHGFGRVEPVILAALVTEDPLLLIGRSGTGKTYLLNTLSEALGLEHRYYNASLISFDDLVGFAYPDKDSAGVRFLETPATVWRAESVLVDELSRCNPEHQNRLFSLVHERRIQGLPLERLRFRLAAMNPCTADQDATELYTGSEPLDPALADRFALFVEAADWDQLDDAERRLIVDPSGEGRVTGRAAGLRSQIGAWRESLLSAIESSPVPALAYATAAVTALTGAGVRISPRRSRLLARNLVAAAIVTGEAANCLYRLVLECSLPHATWGARPAPEVVAAAYRLAWETASATRAAWVHRSLGEPSLRRKLEALLDECRSPDEGSQPVAQLLASGSRERAVTFAYAIYPPAAAGTLPIGAEGVNDLAALATPVLRVDGRVRRQERLATQGTRHPDHDRFAQVLARREKAGGRAERTRQHFDWRLVEKTPLSHPSALADALNGCVDALKARGLA